LTLRSIVYKATTKKFVIPECFHRGSRFDFFLIVELLIVPMLQCGNAAAQQRAATKAPQQAPKTDTASISKLAQKLASDGDPATLEAQESSAEKSGETAKGKA
jgi:hypothetical protein